MKYYNIEEEQSELIDEMDLEIVELKQKLNLYKNTLTLISQLPDVRIDEAQVIAMKALDAE